MLVARLGWQLPGGGDHTVPLLKATVKSLTLLQLGALIERRRVLHAAFVAEALGLGAAAAPQDAVDAFCADTLPRLWQLPWENSHKEALWRLAVDGVPLLGNTHIGGVPAACKCGMDLGGASPRLHHFWACPVAQAVVGAVSGASGSFVSRDALWLVRCPAAWTRRFGMWCAWRPSARLNMVAVTSRPAAGRMGLWPRSYSARAPRPLLIFGAVSAVS